MIDTLLTHCGLWPCRSTRTSPEVDELVFELDAACFGNSIDMPDEAEESLELTDVDIDTFLTNY